MGKAMPIPEEMDDRGLLETFRDTRSESAFTELVHRHLPLVFQVAYRRLGSATLAEDAAQHAFALLAAKVTAVAKHPERLRAWLHRTTCFEASTLARKEARLSRLPFEPAPTPMNRPEIYDRLDEALDKLPELDRELVLRHCCGGEDYRRMAAVVGKSEATCQKRVERSLARLSRSLGGARTTTVVAAFVATTAKLPASEGIAAAALKQNAATGSVAGSISATKATACAALVLAGGVAGWQNAPKPPAPPLEVTATVPASHGFRTAVARQVSASLSKPPIEVKRPLDEVLESVLAGRFAPLIEFLPKATVADLRAIMAEDDIGELAEGMGGFGAAHDLAVRRWVEIEPAAAFEYGLGRSTRLAARMLARWMETDPRGAASAFLDLPVYDRQELLGVMAPQDDEIAGELAAISPDIAWIVEEHRLTFPVPLDADGKAERLVSDLLEGKRTEEPADSETACAVDAFQRLARKDRDTAVKRAALIPWPALRAHVLASLGQPLPSESLPRGAMRSEALAGEADRLMSSDPEAAIARLKSASPGDDRDRLHAAVSKRLMGIDPWRLLEISASLEGTVKGRGIGPALTAAGRSAPRRAAAMLPELAHHFTAFEGLRGHAGFLLSGWLESDVIGAARWAAEAGIHLGAEAFERSDAPPETLLGMFSDPDERVRAMAPLALRRHAESAIAEGTAESFFDRMPADAADDLIGWIAADAGGRGSHDEALAIARLATPAAKTQKVLPQVGLLALRHDPDGAAAWMRSLPDDERQAVVEGVERIVGGPHYGGGDEEKIRKTLQPLIAP